MKKYKVKGRFSTVVVQDGSNVPLSFTEGQEIELEDDLAALVAQDLPGYLTEIKPVKKPAAKKPTVETADGPSETSATRQVTKTKKPAAKKTTAKTGKK